MRKELGLSIFVLFGILAIIYDAFVVLPKRSQKSTLTNQIKAVTPVHQLYEFSGQSFEIATKTAELGAF